MFVSEKILSEVETGDLCIRIVKYSIVRDMGGFGFKGTIKSVI